MANFDLDIDPELEQIMMEATVDNDIIDDGNIDASVSDASESVNSVLVPAADTFKPNEALKYIQKQRSVNTTVKTTSDVKKFLAFVNKKGDTRQLISIPPNEMDQLLCQFVMDAKKPDGSNYEPDTVSGFVRSIDRYLRDRGYQHNLLTDVNFDLTRRVLEAKRKELKSLGLGNKDNRALPLTPEQEELLWEKHILGDDTPEKLQRTLWFLLTIQLGLRARHEARQTQWSDINLENDENGEYLTFRERSTKTRTGVSNECRSFQPKAYANSQNVLKCPVRLYKLFRDRRPIAMLDAESPFYLAINHAHKSLSSTDEVLLRKWYKNSPLGSGKLASMMKDMAKLAGFVGKYTNHSLRKTMCTNLLQAGVSPTLIQQLSGHKNVASISNYAVASKRQQKEMGHILANPGQVTASATSSICQQKLPLESRSSGNTSAENELSCNTNGQVTSTANIVSSVQSGHFSGANINGCTFNIFSVNQK